MDFLITDCMSKRAVVITGKSLFSYDGDSKVKTRKIADLSTEPQQIQEGYDSKRVLVAVWNLGLRCYDLSSGEIVWQSAVPERVAGIVYESLDGCYFVESEDSYGCVEIDPSGRRIRSFHYRIIHAFHNGQFLFTAGPDRKWMVRDRRSGDVICAGGELKGLANTLAGDEDLMAVSPVRGVVEVYDLHSGKQVYRLDPRNWFSIKSLIKCVEPRRFRFLVSDWGGKPAGAVIEIDLDRNRETLVSESASWGYNSALMNQGKTVLRFFPKGEERFVEFDLNRDGRNF